MKNLLLASTALVAFAGAAAAEVAISGSGRLGIVYDNSSVIVNEKLRRTAANTLERSADSGFRFSSRMRILFTLTSETDAGVSFGASIRADNAAGGENGQAGSVFMSGAFGKLSLGDVDGAAESAVGNLSGVGYTGIGDLNEAIYLQQGNSDLSTSGRRVTEFALPAATYEYTTGPASFYFSLGNPAGIKVNTTFFDTLDVKISDTVIDSAIGVGAKYAVENYSFGFGYETIDVSGVATNRGADGVFGKRSINAGADGLDNTADDTVVASDDTVTEFKNTVDLWILGGSGTFGGFTAKAQYGEGSGKGVDLTQYGFSGDYTFDAFTVTAFWASKEIKAPGDTKKERRQPFGLGVKYDLGGGASIAAGAVDPDIKGEDYRADVGLNFSF